MKNIFSTIVKALIGLIVAVILLLALFGLFVVSIITYAYVKNSW